MNGEKWLSEQIDYSDRDKRLLRRCVWTLYHNVIDTKNAPWGDSRGIAPSIEKYDGVWNWDSAFHAMALRRWDMKLAREQLDIMLKTQLPDGRISDSYYTNGKIVKECSKPPVWAWVYMLMDQTDPNDAELARVYDHFIKWEGFWREKRKDKSLFYFDADEDGESYRGAQESREQMRAMFAKFESGMDTSARWANNDVNQIWAIDLNCYLALYYRALTYMSNRLNKTENAAHFAACERALAEAINEYLWDEENGRYIDAYRSTNAFSSVFTPMSYLPLFAGIAPSDRAERMAAHAADEALFYPGMPCCAYNDPSYRSNIYWEGPTWINLDYMMLKGLKNYGYGKLAEELRQLLLYWCDREKRGLFEYYDSISGEGLGANHYGWTAALILEMIVDGSMDCAG